MVCLQQEFSWKVLGRDANHSWIDLQDALIPAARWEQEISDLVDMARDRVPGFTLGFHAVHARTEGDFHFMCTRLNWVINKYCYVSEGLVAAALIEKFSVPQNDLLFISSNARLSDLPTLCSAFRCFDLPVVCPECMARGYLEQAHMRYLFALRGKDAFGNSVSSFYDQIKYSMHKMGKNATGYNGACNSTLQDCKIQPERTQL